MILLAVSTKNIFNLDYFFCFVSHGVGDLLLNYTPKTLTFINLTIKRSHQFCLIFVSFYYQDGFTFPGMLLLYLYLWFKVLFLSTPYSIDFGRLVPYVLCTRTHYMSTAQICILYMCQTHVTYMCTHVIKVTKLLSNIY